MTLRQAILKFFYPVTRKLSSYHVRLGQIVLNQSNQTALEPFSSLSAVKNNGADVKMSEFIGKKILVVNTASNCGFTGQYAELEQLFKENESRLIILAFPSNDFKEQEKGNDASIAQFCSTQYGISFPVFQKAGVIKSASQHPVYRWLTASNSNGWCNQKPVWNFSKYLIDENGNLLGYFGPSVSPADPTLVKLINQ